jgi:hypothetical protein
MRTFRTGSLLYPTFTPRRAFFGPPVLVATWNQTIVGSAPAGVDVGDAEALEDLEIESTAPAGVDTGTTLFTSTVVAADAGAGADVGAADTPGATSVGGSQSAGVDFDGSDVLGGTAVAGTGAAGVTLITRFDGYGSPTELSERSGLYLLETAFTGHPECGWTPTVPAVFSLDRAVPLPCEVPPVPAMILDRDSFLVYLPPIVPSIGSPGQRAGRVACTPRRNPTKTMFPAPTDPSTPEPTEWTAPFVTGDWEELEDLAVDVQTRTVAAETSLLAFFRTWSYSSCGTLIHVSGERAEEISEIGPCGGNPTPN